MQPKDLNNYNHSIKNKSFSIFHDLGPSLQESINEIIEKEGFVQCELEKRTFDSGGGNFLAELLEVDIKGKTADGEKEINLFIKQKINLDQIKLVDIDSLYLKEAFFYNEVSEIITAFQDKANVPIEERYKIAKSFGSHANAIVLDNLAKKGFKTVNRLDVINIKYAELAVIELAKFHSLSFVIEDRMPEFYKNKLQIIRHPFNCDDDWKGMITNVCLYIASLYDGDVKRRIENFLPKAVVNFVKYNNDTNSVKCCLTHGDYRINNILVREENGEPVEILPVDYQLMDYGNPVRDFLFFIYSSTDRKFRINHMNDLKELYFKTMSRFLKYFNMDIEVVYPKKEFESMYAKWLDYGLMMSLHGAKFLFSPESGLDLKNLTLSELPFEPDEIFNERARGWVEDCLEWGFL